MPAKPLGGDETKALSMTAADLEPVTQPASDMIVAHTQLVVWDHQRVAPSRVALTRERWEGVKTPPAAGETDLSHTKWSLSLTIRPATVYWIKRSRGPHLTSRTPARPQQDRPAVRAVPRVVRKCTSTEAYNKAPDRLQIIAIRG